MFKKLYHIALRECGIMWKIEGLRPGMSLVIKN